jgi:hypothetical protein
MQKLKSRLLFSLLVSALLATADVAAVVETAQVLTIAQETPTEKKAITKVTPAAAEQGDSLAYQSLEQLSELTDIGLSGLAMRMIEHQQKQYPEFSPEWYAFEFKYFQTLSALELWQEIIDRADKLLDRAEQGQQITAKITQWIESQQAIAWLQLGEAEQSLQLTRRLLWQAAGENRDRTAFWRRLIIRAYLQLDYAEDANKALRKYRRDYGDYTSEWKLLQAQALLRANRPAEVVDLLAEEKSDKAKALRILAEVRAHPDKAKRHIKQIEQHLQDANLSQAQQRAYFYVLYEAYVAGKDRLAAAETVEKLLALSRSQAVLGEHFSVDADDLWLLYEQVGEQTGNQHKLLKGNDSAWSKRAAAVEKKEPVRARALYAVVALAATDEASSQLAHKAIVDSLATTDGGLEVVNQLYVESTRAGSPDRLPVEVRYRLVDYALSVGDISLAATMMASLPKPPEGQAYFDWQMRKARVLILEGDHQKGEAELKSSLQNITELNADRVDRYLQVVFDLQTINRHEQALELFDLLPVASMPDELRREIYYWKAESHYELERYDQAAMLYMRSAKAGDETMSDLWAQSARFKAADALLKAKLYDDAKHAYAELLAITSSDARKRLIRQKLQHIRLLRSKEAPRVHGEFDEEVPG